MRRNDGNLVQCGGLSSRGGSRTAPTKPSRPSIVFIPTSDRHGGLSLHPQPPIRGFFNNPLRAGHCRFNKSKIHLVGFVGLREGSLFYLDGLRARL